MEDGFLNLWHASIPLAEQTVKVDGVCTVLVQDGLIYANHVFFDPSELLKALADSSSESW